MSILFVCNAGPEVGGGHVMRSLTLARALQARDAAVSFLCPPAVTALLEAFAPDIHRVWAGSTEPARIVAAVRAAKADLVVFDHYGLDADDHRAAAGARPVLVIDDLADRPLGADLVLDSGPSRMAEDYAGLLPGHAALLLGPANAPVRPEFAALRPAALNRRLAGGPPRRLLVSLGLGDPGGITGKVLELLLPMTGDLVIDAVMGSAAPSLSKVQALALVYPQLRLHIDSREMAALTAEADLAVGGGGSSSWERCVLALPTLLLILADNQRPAARALETAGAVMALEADAADFTGLFEEDLARLLADARLRTGMALAAADVCDGEGADRVAEAVMGLMRG
ncbi:MAG: UDP-2,4-diacetamido-2,4,6-trideoxy-beta-L-altropyranose hydrolase [Caulobacter sp.]|nr:UDP-2,4-diacetamido-2,4,6-trideoxy-beta-L-altropyranose hydrolase [Caulobacter sp.]